MWHQQQAVWHPQTQQADSAPNKHQTCRDVFLLPCLERVCRVCQESGARTRPQPVESHILNSLRSLKALLLALPILPASRSCIASIIDSSRSLQCKTGGPHLNAHCALWGAVCAQPQASSHRWSHGRTGTKLHQRVGTMRGEGGAHGPMRLNAEW